MFRRRRKAKKLNLNATDTYRWLLICGVRWYWSRAKTLILIALATSDTRSGQPWGPPLADAEKRIKVFVLMGGLPESAPRLGRR